MAESNRIAEMVHELFGAKAAAEIVRDVWATASPEARREVSDAVLALIRKSVDEKGDWTVQNEVVRVVSAIARSEAESWVLKDDFHAKVLEKIERVAPSCVERVCDEAVRVVVGDVIEKVRGRLRPQPRT